MEPKPATKPARPATLDDLASQLGEISQQLAAAAAAAEPPLRRSQLTVAQKVALINERGPEAYLQVPF